MVFDRPNTQTQCRCDLLIAEPPRDRFSDPPLGVGQFFVPRQNFVRWFILANQRRDGSLGSLDSTQNASDDRDQLIRFERLCQINVDTRSKALDPITCIILSGEKDNGNEFRMWRRPEMTGERMAVHQRHFDVADDKIGDRLSDLEQGVLAVASGGNLKILAAQDRRNREQEIRLIINQ